MPIKLNNLRTSIKPESAPDPSTYLTIYSMPEVRVVELVSVPARNKSFIKFLPDHIQPTPGESG